MQQRIAKAKPEYIKGKNYRARPLKSGEWQIEIRSTEYGYDTKRLPVGIKKADIHKHARKMLQDMANADVPELARKTLSKITLNKLIDAYLTVAEISKRDRDFIARFQKDNPSLCSKRLDQHSQIRRGFDDYIDRKKKGIVIGYTSSGKTVYGPAWTVTRGLSPLRTMYRDAGKKKLYGLIDDKITLASPISGDEIDYPDNSPDHRTQYLKPFEERKIFIAIEQQCKRSNQSIKWITLVSMALITCLRRGVLVKIRWRDVDFDNKWIAISKTYWKGGKRAPEYVPITDKLYVILKRYYDNLPDRDKTPDSPVFQKYYRNKKVKNGRGETWTDSTWHDAIRRTDLWKEKKTPEGETIYDAPKNGKVVRDYFNFHDLRATGESWYEGEPYNLNPEEYGYLMGHLGRKTNTQDKYDRAIKEKCNRIRQKINQGEALLARTLQKPGGDVKTPYDIAFNRTMISFGFEEVFKNRRTLLKKCTDMYGKEEAERQMAEFERFVDRFNSVPSDEAVEQWLEEKAKADDFNQPREDYKRKYGMYPEDDTVMQVWKASTGATPVDGNRAKAYALCLLRSVYYKKEKGARYRFGIEARPQEGK